METIERTKQGREDPEPKPKIDPEKVKTKINLLDYKSLSKEELAILSRHTY